MTEAKDVAPADIELGATDDTLRLWCAKEAVQQGCLRRKEQADALASMQTRAASLLGWNVTGLLALAVPIAAENHLLAACVASTWLALGSILCVLVLRIRKWPAMGWNIEPLLALSKGSELEFLEQQALGHLDAIKITSVLLDNRATLLHFAYLLFALSAPAGFIFLFLKAA